jgi:5-methylcytosine-specific restriction endonuclease McrA
MDELEQVCPRCHRRHRADLPCWVGRYAQRMVWHVLHSQGRVCWICGEHATSADHVRPRSRGGDDSDENLRPCCGPCNARRGNKPNPFPPTSADVAPSGVGLSPRWRNQ